MDSGHSRRVTTATLARRLGLSRATVSYVLNGQAELRKISEETAQRVIDEAQRVNFIPNALARGLRLKRSGLIGFLVGSFTFNWAEKVLTAMLGVLEGKGCLPFTMIHRWSPEIEQTAITSMLQRRVDGVICVPVPGHEAAYQKLKQQGIPLLFLGDRLERMEDVSFIAWDVEEPSQKAVRHLVEIGCRRIAFMAADHQTVMTRARYRGYEKALKEAGLPVDRQLVAWEPVPPFPSPPDMVNRMLDRILQPGRQRPDALFIGHDALAVRALDLLTTRGLRVPEDLAMVSLGDLFLSDHSSIGLSSMREPSEELGRRAGEIILSLIDHPNQQPIQELISFVDLKVRRSTQPSDQQEERLANRTISDRT